MLKRALLVTEWVVLYGPVFALLLAGFFYFPVAVHMASSGNTSGLLGSAVYFFGLWGFVSASHLSLYVIAGQNRWPGKPVQWFGLISGSLVSLVCLAGNLSNPLLAVVFLAPVIGNIHFVYLSRRANHAI